jgi:hypothetical protein
MESSTLSQVSTSSTQGRPEVLRQILAEAPKEHLSIRESKSYGYADFNIVSGNTVLASVHDLHVSYLRTVNATNGIVAVYVTFDCNITGNGYRPSPYSLTYYLGCTVDTQIAGGGIIDAWRLPATLGVPCQGTMPSNFTSDPKPDFYDSVTGAIVTVDRANWYLC